jgi:carboxymethylenebutenolidase
VGNESDRSDLAAVYDSHVASEFALQDLDATMATMVEAPHLILVPTMAGGVGSAEVREFYGAHFIGQWPDDLTGTSVSRTVGTDRVVDEMIMQWTHTKVMDAFLPGMAPTGKVIRLPIVVIAEISDGKVASEHLYWDQASLLMQVGALDRSDLPISGAEQADKLLERASTVQ